MEANKTLLQMKYARIIYGFSKEAEIPAEKALELFYNSTTYQLMREGISDMHCYGDGYLIDELKLEFGYMEDIGCY